MNLHVAIQRSRLFCYRRFLATRATAKTRKEKTIVTEQLSTLPQLISKESDPLKVVTLRKRSIKKEKILSADAAPMKEKSVKDKQEAVDLSSDQQLAEKAIFETSKILAQTVSLFESKSLKPKVLKKGKKLDKTEAKDEAKVNSLENVPKSSTGATSPPQFTKSPQNYLLNFPLCADHTSPEMASLLVYDRVVDFGIKRYPSVGSIMRDSQTPQQIFLLKRWREKKVAELGSDAEFNMYVQRIKSEGERLHNCLRLFLSENMPEKDLPMADSLKPLWTSFRPVLDKISQVLAVETAVHHKPLGYIGIADCVAEIDGQLVVIDWKVSERQRVNLAQTYDTPIQIIAYIGAINAHYATCEAQKLHPRLVNVKKEDTNHLYIPPKLIRHGLAVIGYRDGSPAHVHVIDEGACQFYWEKWLEKVHQYWHKKSNPIPPSPPPSPIETLS